MSHLTDGKEDHKEGYTTSLKRLSLEESLESGFYLDVVTPHASRTVSGVILLSFDVVLCIYDRTVAVYDLSASSMDKRTHFHEEHQILLLQLRI